MRYTTADMKHRMKPPKYVKKCDNMKATPKGRCYQNYKDFHYQYTQAEHDVVNELLNHEVLDTVDTSPWKAVVLKFM